MKSLFIILLFVLKSRSQEVNRLGKFQEVYAWKQMTFDINGDILLQDRFAGLEENRKKRQVFFSDASGRRGGNYNYNDVTTENPSKDERGKYFIQYNNVPMGVEKVGDRLFVALPRRRYGIPSTLAYINLSDTRRSPALIPFPSVYDRSLISVYRTRADVCGRLWMVDTGLLELPVTADRQQLQPPAIVVYDLKTDKLILRYQFKTSDIPAANTPTGLASITIDINGDCDDAYAYVPDLTTFGIIVFSLREMDSWRLSHNFFNFNPLAGELRVAGEHFQWSDGIFSITITEPTNGCRTAYFHPLISTQEFSVSTCVLKNKTASADPAYFTLYSYVGDRGRDSQSTMHDYDTKNKVIFFADIGRDAVSCWNTGRILDSSNVAILARDTQRMSYPSDLHVTDNEVWVIANTLPRFGYSRLDTNEYNFYVYKANVDDLIAGTVCAPASDRMNVLQDRFAGLEENRRKTDKRQVFFSDASGRRGGNYNYNDVTTENPSKDERGKYFIQYNNVPMGVEKVGDRLFVALPRRRYGIPSTLAYINLSDTRRSPALIPFPSVYDRSLISVYRTRADVCGRLWMVDTGLLELPVTADRQQLQPPAIVVYDLKTDKLILRYQFKTSDIPAANTPTGLASITIDINGDCDDAYAYVPDLTTFGIIVFSLREMDSWRLSHNFFNFNPLAGELRVAGEHFQWSDGIFSITITEPTNGCRTAYFHPLISTQEFSVSTCVLKNKTASADPAYFTLYSYVGDRGRDSQSTMHDYDTKNKVIFFADIGRDAVSCWNTGRILDSSNVAILARDTQRMSYPSDLHVTDNEVWVIANTLPRFGYSRLDTNEYNFYVYKANVDDLIAGTVCAPASDRMNG